MFGADTIKNAKIHRIPPGCGEFWGCVFSTEHGTPLGCLNWENITLIYRHQHKGV